MADDGSQGTDSSAEFGKAKRPPPTIELEATEVTGETAKAEGGGETSAETPPPGDRPKASWIGSATISALAGAVAAGLVIAAVWLLAWPGEAVPSAVAPQADHAAVDALVARIANIESKTNERANEKAVAPSPSTPDPAVVTRIDALEKTVASLREELSASRSRSERLVAAVNDLKAAPRDPSPAPPPDLSSINEKIAEIERSTRAQIAEAARQEGARPADDKPLRRVVAATLLELSVRQSEPYAAALATAKALAPDPNVLKPLEPFAATGMPNPNALSRDLLAALLPKPAAAPASATTTGTGIIDRLQAGAARLVRIERTDAADTADRTAVVVRAAAAAQRNDIAGARRELNSLTGAERAAVQPGIDRLDARDAALSASHQFAVDALAALSKTAP
jgi:hypothetical protein